MQTTAVLESILGQAPQAAPARFEGEEAAAVMPIREGQTCWYALRDGHLVGLNLAETNLTDEQWQQIRAADDFDPARIEALNLRDNRLTRSPVEGMTALRWLDLSGNQLRDFALSPGAAGPPEHLWLHGNPDLKNPPPEIVARGRFAVAHFFRESQQQEVVYLREAKLLLLGEGGTGKTSLALKMKDLRNPLPSKDDSTRGIAVETLRIGEGDEAFDIHVWDFGGQQVYHGTHRFFLTKRSLYVVLADNRKQNTDFDYWLQMAELYGEASPLYIVVNQTDNRPPYPNLGGMKARFDFLKDLLHANLDTLGEYDRSDGAAARNTADTQKLVARLTGRIREMDHVSQTLPKSWVDIRQALGSVQRDYITLERYREICAAHGMPDQDGQDDQLRLSEFLHDLGVILHFQHDAALRETVILRMTWATDAVFRMYDSPLVHSGEQPGFFQKNDIRNIWAEPAYRDKQEQLLALMLRFKLCYRIGESDEYVMPELLPLAQPDYAAHIPALQPEALHNASAVRYSYEFMPKGIFARFAVEVHRMIAQGQQFIWREGAVLQSGESFALVTETYGSREIVVRATGARRRQLMSIATHHLDSIHASFPKLRVTKLVPCNCEKCAAGGAVPHYFDHDNLMLRLEAGQATAECGKSWKPVPVGALLDELFATEPIPPPEPPEVPISEESPARNEAIEAELNLIRELIAHGETRQALEIFKKINPNEAAILLGKFTTAGKKLTKGLMHDWDHRQVIAEIHEAMLSSG